MAFGALLVFMASLMAASNPLGQGCVAASHNHDGMCYRTPVHASRVATSTLSNYPIGFAVNPSQLLSQGVLGTYGWDALPLNAGNSEIQGLLQDLTATATSSTWWLFGDVKGGDGSNAAPTSFNLYSGNATQKRDQGMGFSVACGNLGGSCSDSVTLTDHSGLRFTDNFDVIVDVQTFPATNIQSASLVNKLLVSSGYRLAINTNGQLEAEVGNGATTFLATTTWDGTRERVRMRFDAGAANDLTISFFNDATGVYDAQVSANSGFASLATSTTNVSAGGGLTGTIFELELRENVGASDYGRVAHLGFNPVDVAQTQEGNEANSWNWRGTIGDQQAAVFHTYSFIRDQSVFSNVRVGATAFAFSTPSTQVTETVRSVLGDISSSNFATTPSDARWSHLGIFGDYLSRAQDGSSLGANAFMYMFIFFVALGLGGLTFWFLGRNETLFGIILIAIFGLGAGLHMIPAWWAVVTGIIVLTAWLLSARPQTT